MQNGRDQDDHARRITAGSQGCFVAAASRGPQRAEHSRPTPPRSSRILVRSPRQPLNSPDVVTPHSPRSMPGSATSSRLRIALIGTNAR